MVYIVQNFIDSVVFDLYRDSRRDSETCIEQARTDLGGRARTQSDDDRGILMKQDEI